MRPYKSSGWPQKLCRYSILPCTRTETTKHHARRITSEPALSHCVFWRLWIRYYGHGEDSITTYCEDINHMCSTVLVQAGVVGQWNYVIQAKRDMLRKWACNFNRSSNQFKSTRDHVLRVALWPELNYISQLATSEAAFTFPCNYIWVNYAFMHSSHPNRCHGLRGITIKLEKLISKNIIL
jgi:hypothetical protein